MINVNDTIYIDNKSQIFSYYKKGRVFIGYLAKAEKPIEDGKKVKISMGNRAMGAITDK